MLCSNVNEIGGDVGIYVSSRNVVGVGPSLTAVHFALGVTEAQLANGPSNALPLPRISKKAVAPSFTECANVPHLNWVE